MSNTIHAGQHKIKCGVVIYCTKDCDEGRQEAKDWLKAKGLTPDQVKLYSSGGMVLAETKAPVYIK